MGTSAEITFQHKKRRVLEFLPKTEKMLTIFNSAEIGFSGAVHILEPKLSPGNSAEIAGNSAEIVGNSAEICQQSIPPKLVSNDGIPPKAGFKREI